tara:strand:- start:10703 stop:12577 length:1875 start_codon:yes stop_codon:yes gene_type:complete
MANSTIVSDLPKKVASSGGSSFVPSSSGGGGLFPIQALPGPRPQHGDMVSKGKGLYNDIYNVNKVSPKNLRYTMTNSTQGAAGIYPFIVDEGRSIAMMGLNQYSNKGAGNHSSWDYNGATLHSPWQWVSIYGTVLMEIALKTQAKSAFPDTWAMADLKDHAFDDGVDGFKIVGVYTGYTQLVLFKNGIMMANGYNGHGQVGDSSTSNRAAWRVVGHSFSTASASSNWYDRPYYDTRINKKRKFVQVTNACELYESANTFHALADDKTLWGWGYNGYGQTGTNNSTTSNAATYRPRCCVRQPKTTHGYSESGVQYVEDAVYVKATNGQYGTCIYLDADGKLWGTGRNSYYQMQHAHGNNQSTFVPLGHSGSSTWNVSNKCTKFDLSGNGDVCFSAFLFDDGTVSTGGYSGYGQIMSGSTAGTNNHTSLAAYFGPSGTFNKAIDLWTVGGQYGQLFVLTEDYRLFGAGYSGYGQLGGGRTGGTYTGREEQFTDWASQVAGTTEPWHKFNSKRFPVKFASGGWGSTNSIIMLLSDGTVWHTGRNNAYQRYRQGANYYYWTTPQLPYNAHGKVVDVWVGDYSSDSSTHYFLMESGALYCTGYYHSWDSNTWYTHDNPIIINGQMAGIA